MVEAAHSARCASSATATKPGGKRRWRRCRRRTAGLGSGLVGFSNCLAPAKIRWRVMVSEKRAKTWGGTEFRAVMRFTKQHFEVIPGLLDNDYTTIRHCK